MKISEAMPKLASKCQTCGGDGVLPGRLPDNTLLPCPTCEGKGVINKSSQKKRVEEKPCDNPNCKHGKVMQLTVVDGHDEMVEKTCPVCDGYGVVYKEITETTTESELCPSCNGKGMLIAADMRKKKLEGLCPDCHGTGVVMEDEPVKKVAKFGVLSILAAPVAIVSLSFKFMMSAVKIVLGKFIAEKKNK